MSDNYLKRMADEDALRGLLQRIEDLEEQVKVLSPGEQQGLYLPWSPRYLNPLVAGGLAGNVLGDFVLPKKYGGLLGFGASIYVVSPNSGSHYWVPRLRSISTGLIIAEFTTSGKTPDTWHPYFTKNVVTAPAANDQLFYITMEVNGTPGNAYMVPYCVIL